MSRGIKIHLVTTAFDPTPSGTATWPSDLQYLDIAYLKNESSIGTVTTGGVSDSYPVKIWQKGVSNWTEIKIVDHTAIDSPVKDKTKFADEVIRPNVTSIRKAHIEDIRSKISLLELITASRLGEKYYNTHDYSNAVQLWKSGTYSSILGIYTNSTSETIYSTETDTPTPSDTSVVVIQSKAANAGKALRLLLQEDSMYYRIGFSASGGTKWANDPVIDIFKDTVIIYKDLLVNKSAYIRDKLVVLGDVGLRSKLYVNDDLMFKAILKNKNSSFTVDQTGAITAGVSLFNGPVTFKSSVTFEGDVKVGGKIYGIIAEYDDDHTKGAQFETHKLYPGLNAEYINGYSVSMEKIAARIDSPGMPATYIPLGYGTESNAKNYKQDNFNADLLDGCHAGNSTGNVPISNKDKCDDLNADMLDDYHVGHKTIQIPVSDGLKCETLHADMLDNYHAGHGVGEIPISDGLLCHGLNADRLNGKNWGTAWGEIPISNDNKCDGLNADYLDDKHYADILLDITTGSASTTNALFPSLNNKNGWQKFPGGILFQWGQCTYPTPATFLITFTNIFSVTASGEHPYAVVGISSYSTSGISFTTNQPSVPAHNHGINYYESTTGANSSNTFSVNAANPYTYIVTSTVQNATTTISHNNTIINIHWFAVGTWK